jgi:hypothetical protein
MYKSIAGISGAICSLDLVDDMVESLLPHAERVHRSAVSAKAQQNKVHNHTVEASHRVTLELSHGRLSVLGQVVVQYLEQSSILTFPPWMIILAGMKQLIVDLMIHCPPAEQDANEQIKICLEQMDDSQSIQFKAVRLLVNHNIDNLKPSAQVLESDAGNDSNDKHK